MEKAFPHTIPHPALSKAAFIHNSHTLKGYIAMGVVLFIWSGFSLTARAVSSSPLSIADMALIRFAVPLVLLAPMLLSHLKEIRTARLSDILFILLGGIPFLFFASWGAQTTPTAYVGTILVGTPPFFIAI